MRLRDLFRLGRDNAPLFEDVGTPVRHELRLALDVLETGAANRNVRSEGMLLGDGDAAVCRTNPHAHYTLCLKLGQRWIAVASIHRDHPDLERLRQDKRWTLQLSGGDIRWQQRVEEQEQERERQLAQQQREAGKRLAIREARERQRRARAAATTRERLGPPR